MTIIANPYSELIREPNLLIPGKKPIGPVKIDWTNSLAKGLYKTLLARSLTVGSDLLGLNLTPIGDGSIQPTNRGLSLYASGGSDNYFTVPNVQAYPTSTMTSILGVIPLATTSSRIFGIYASDGIDSNDYNGFGDNTDCIEIHFAVNSSGYWIWLNQNETQDGPSQLCSSTTSPVAGRYDVLAATSISGIQQKLYLNGQTIGTSSENWSTNEKVSTYTRINQVGQASAGRGGNGYVVFQWTWSRILTVDEISSISRDPYQFLIPA